MKKIAYQLLFVFCSFIFISSLFASLGPRLCVECEYHSCLYGFNHGTESDRLLLEEIEQVCLLQKNSHKLFVVKDWMKKRVGGNPHNITHNSSCKKRSIIVDEDWFAKASESEKKFWLGHEVGHTVFQDTEKYKEISSRKAWWQSVGGPLFTWGMGILGLGVALGIIYQCQDDDSLVDILGSFLVSFMGGLTGSFVGAMQMSKTCQNEEYAADAISVTKLNCHNEAIDALKKSQNWFKDEGQDDIDNLNETEKTKVRAGKNQST